MRDALPPVMGDLAIGARIGDYVIDSELAGRLAGRMFQATHVLLPRRAHIVMSALAFETACVLETLRHPAVPRIYECGLTPQPWVALAVVDGRSLATAIAERPLPVADTLRLLADLAGILAHAHASGVVHGELCAERIVETSDGWRIADWTDAGVATDTATDIHALGVVAYGALARCLPTLPLARRCPGVPAGLSRLIDRMISESPPAQAVLEEATRLAELAAMPEVEVFDDDEPIAIEDIILLDVEPLIPQIPPPVPTRLRWTPAGGLVTVPRRQS